MSALHKASWTPERRARQAARLRAINARPEVREKITRACQIGNAERHRGRLAIPPHAHPLVRGLFETMNRERTTPVEVAVRAGIGDHTVRSWRKRHMPQLDMLDAALNVLDLELAIVPRGRRGPDGFLRHRRSSLRGGEADEANQGPQAPAWRQESGVLRPLARPRNGKARKEPAP